MTKISSITPEQESLITVYREKWQKIAISTNRLDRNLASKVVKAVYNILGKSEPEIIFFDSPYGALKAILLGKIKLRSNTKKQAKKIYSEQLYIGKEIWSYFVDRQVTKIWKKPWYIHSIEKDPLWKKIRTELSFPTNTHLNYHRTIWYFLSELKKKERNELNNLFRKFIIDSEFLTNLGCLFDYCISVLKWECERKEWETLQLLIENCGCFFPYERICFICERPTKLSLDSENLLHGNGESALEFADGYKLYAYHGVIIPEKYGFFHPNEWQAEWLLQEKNAGIKRALIQGIGYENICQQLNAIKLNSWREYTLLKIDNNIDIEPIYLLKMTCPSTRHIHALRVPPTIKTAREAITWVNHGIDSEMFTVES